MYTAEVTKESFDKTGPGEFEISLLVAIYDDTVEVVSKTYTRKHLKGNTVATTLGGFLTEILQDWNDFSTEADQQTSARVDNALDALADEIAAAINPDEPEIPEE